MQTSTGMMETKRAIWLSSEDHESPGFEDLLMEDEDVGLERIDNIDLGNRDQDQLEPDAMWKLLSPGPRLTET